MSRHEERGDILTFRTVTPDGSLAIRQAKTQTGKRILFTTRGVYEMKVAVVGSWRAQDASEWGLKSQDMFPEACRQIGNAIMRLGHTLVIGSESEHTADRYAVEGAIQAIGGSSPDRPRIIVLRPNDQHVPFEQLRNENPGIFTTRVSMDSGWNVTSLLQVNEADGLVVVGRRSSKQ